MAKGEPSPQPRTFVYRAGTRIAGTVIACDAVGGGDLLFVSNGRTVTRERSRRFRSGRAQILTTAETLALMGPSGDRLRARALLVGYGKPFALGSLRVELFPSGHMPGAASLAIETGSDKPDGKKIVYAGAARLDGPATAGPAGAVRAADALCLDATFGAPRFAFLPAAEAAAAAVRFARATREAGAAPIFLAGAFGPAEDVAAALAAGGFRVRGHRANVAAAAAYRRAGVALPPIARFAGTLDRDEALVWPVQQRRAGQLGRLGPARAAWVSGWAADAAAAGAVGADLAIPYSRHADHAGLLAYVAATGAREIALQNGFAETLAETLRDRGLFAYVVGPPHQIPLPPVGGDASHLQKNELD